MPDVLFYVYPSSCTVSQFPLSSKPQNERSTETAEIQVEIKRQATRHRGGREGGDENPVRERGRQHTSMIDTSAAMIDSPFLEKHPSCCSPPGMGPPADESGRGRAGHMTRRFGMGVWADCDCDTAQWQVLYCTGRRRRMDEFLGPVLSQHPSRTDFSITDLEVSVKSLE